MIFMEIMLELVMDMEVDREVDQLMHVAPPFVQIYKKYKPNLQLMQVAPPGSQNFN